VRHISKINPLIVLLLIIYQFSNPLLGVVKENVFVVKNDIIAAIVINEGRLVPKKHLTDWVDCLERMHGVYSQMLEKSYCCVSVDVTPLSIKSNSPELSVYLPLGERALFFWVKEEINMLEKILSRENLAHPEIKVSNQRSRRVITDKRQRVFYDKRDVYIAKLISDLNDIVGLNNQFSSKLQVDGFSFPENSNAMEIWGCISSMFKKLAVQSEELLKLK
jgi:hypothetical protein